MLAAPGLTLAIINQKRAKEGRMDPQKNDRSVDRATKTKRFGDLERRG